MNIIDYHLIRVWKVCTGIFGFLAFFCLFVGVGNDAYGQSEKSDLLFQPFQDSIQKYLFTDPEKNKSFIGKYDELALEHEDPFYKAKALNFRGLNTYVQGNHLEAIKLYLKSLTIFDSLQNKWYSAVVMNNIGAAYRARHKPLETISYYEKALEKFKELKDSTWIANLMNNLSIQYVEMGDFDKALRMQSEVLEIFESFQDEASVLLMKGNMADTYFKMGEYNKSRTLAKLYLDHELAEKDMQQKANVLSTMARVEANDKEYNTAIKYIDEAVRIAEELELKQELTNFLRTRSELLENMGLYAEALKSFKQYHQINDTLYSAEKDKQITDLLTKYEVAQKEASITLLEKEKIIAERNQWLMGAGIFALSVILVLIFYLYRNRQKNITELQNKNDVITKMLKEKEYLIKEIHHRVKNNLQIISSLLQLQSRNLEEPNAIEALNDGESRVKSMAIIHQHLYTEDNLSQVNIPIYVDNLVVNLKSSYQKPELDIQIHQDIDDLALDVAEMIPIGLIINELITNSFKYAFSGKSNGNIWITIKSVEEGLQIKVQDDGVGMNAETVSKGFGTRLINAFLRKLNAQMTIHNDNGTVTEIYVPVFKEKIMKTRMTA